MVILRGISTPVQGDDAVNKDYVDAQLGVSDRVQIESTGVTAKSFIRQGNNDFVRMIPVQISPAWVIYAIDIYWFANPANFVIAGLVNTPIKSANLILADVITHDIMDETKVEFTTDSGGEIRVHASGVFGMGYLKLNI